MSLDEWRILFFSAGFLLILIIIAPFAWGFFPSNEEQFTSMAVLGKDMTEGKYFPNDNANITLGQETSWNVILYNHMDATQYMLVKVKLLDSHMSPPNNTLGTWSTEAPIYEIETILAKNETAIIPFQWKILNASTSGNNLAITKMTFNGQPSDLSINLTKGDKLRVILELWLYDTDLRAFKFDVGTKEAPRIVWNQIWFNLKKK